MAPTRKKSADTPPARKTSARTPPERKAPASKAPARKALLSSGSHAVRSVPAVKRAGPADSAVPARAPATAPAQDHAAAKPPAADGKVGRPKAKLVRDSFTMPQADFDLIATLKDRAIRFHRPAKKSELLRAGLHALLALSDARLKAALDALQPLKPGRPRKTV